MLKKFILSVLMLGFITQGTSVKAIEVLNPAPTFEQTIVRDEGLILNSYTIPVVHNCMISFSLSNKQKFGLLGLVVVAAILQTVHNVYRIAQNEENSIDIKK